jgi:serine/threonine protein kinase
VLFFPHLLFCYSSPPTFSIIYRDLKPNNIGFDVRDDVKIFDFGLATEYDPDKVNKNSAFKLTGDTGTIRYMAPEVCLNQPYDETADVYSFSVLLWQIIAMKDPYEGLSDQDVERKVLYAGYRPKIDPQWSNALRRLMQDCFASNPRRPHMDVVCDVLRHEINKLSDKKLVDEEVVDSARSAMSAHY